MKIIDCHTGKEIKIDVPFQSFESEVRILSIRVGILHARVQGSMFYPERKIGTVLEPFDMTLPIRYLHPSFPFQRVIFWPS